MVFFWDRYLAITLSGKIGRVRKDQTFLNRAGEDCYGLIVEKINPVIRKN